LPAVNVTIAASNNAGITEGTGSYTTNATSRSATPLNLSARQTPQAISIVTRQRMDDQALLDVKDVIAATPGLTIQEIGAERYSILSRGYTLSSIQFDGLNTFSDVSTQETPQNFADMSIYDRVETLRGATGLMNGAGEPSGSINLVRKSPTDTFQGSVAASVGSWDKYRAEADLSGPLNKAGTLRGRVIAVHQDNHSHIDYMHQKKSVLYGVVEADLTPNTLLTVGLDYQKRKHTGSVTNIGLPLYYNTGAQITNLPRSLNPAARDNVYDADNLNIFASLEHRLANDWTLKLAANRLQHDSYFNTRGGASWSGFVNPATGNGLSIYEWIGNSSQHQHAADISASGPFELGGRRHELSIGANYLEYTNKTKYDSIRGYGSFNPYTWDGIVIAPPLTAAPEYSDTTWTQEGLYAAARFNPTDKLHVITGLRWGRFSTTYDYRSTSYNNYTKAEDNGKFTPYLGVVYDLSKEHTAYVSYTTIYKPQESRDRNGNFLAPREGNNYEIGLKSEFADGKIQTNVALYHLAQDNLAEVDSGYFVPGTTSAAYRTVKGAQTNGIELELNGQILPRWHVATSYSYSHTKDNQGNRITTVMPLQMAKLWTTYRPAALDNKLTVGAGVRWQSKIYNKSQPWQLNGRSVYAEQNNYATADVMFKYDLTKQLVATLNINNIFDKHYFGSIDTTYNTTMYGTPRNINLNLRYSF
jgi:outer membrane receptor for ferric coprogen and ferric-rhodotorulic acid